MVIDMPKFFQIECGLYVHKRLQNYLNIFEFLNLLNYNIIRSNLKVQFGKDAR